MEARYARSKLESVLCSEQVLRAYRAFCAIGDLVARERNEVQSLSQACDAFVTLSNYRMAWVGYADFGKNQSVKPIAFAGFEKDYLKKVKIVWSDTLYGQGPTGRAIRQDRPIVNNHILTDANFAPWRSEALARGYQSSAAFPLHDWNGSVFGALMLYAPEPNAFDDEEVRIIGHLVRLIAYGVLSIRARKADRKRLRDAQERSAELRAVLDNMLESVFVCDLKGRIVIANRAGLHLLGVQNLREARKYSFSSSNGFLPRATHEHPPEWVSPLQRALRGELVTLCEERLSPSGSTDGIVVRTNAAPIRDAFGRVIGAVKVVRDVTELVEFEKVKGDFVEAAAHELKTPITAVKGYTQLLMRNDRELSETSKALLSQIDLGTVKVDRIVTDLIDVSRLQLKDFELHREQFDLSKLVRKVVEKFCNGQTTCRFQIEENSSAMVFADSARIEQVLTTLLENAAKYSLSAQQVWVRLVVSGRDAVVSVRDQGIGIPQESQKNIFNSFFRAHANTGYDYGGLGVGLYLSHGIIQLHGGKIGFDSQLGHGSTFWFSLPMESEAQR